MERYREIPILIFKSSKETTEFFKYRRKRALPVLVYYIFHILPLFWIPHDCPPKKGRLWSASLKQDLSCQLIIFEEQQNCPWKHKHKQWTYRDIPLHSQKLKGETNISTWIFNFLLEDCWSRHVEATNDSYPPSIYFHGTLDCTTTDNSTNSGQERCLVDFLGHVASTQSKCFVNAALQCPGSNLSRLYIYNIWMLWSY